MMTEVMFDFQTSVLYLKKLLLLILKQILLTQKLRTLNSTFADKMLLTPHKHTFWTFYQVMDVSEYHT